MAKISAREDSNTATKTPRKTQLMMKVTTSSTPSTSTGRQDLDYDSTKGHDDAIQRAVDEQLFRELNATIPPEFRVEDNKTAATPDLSALEVAESRARKVLDAQLATSTASSVVARKVDGKATRAQKKVLASNEVAKGGHEVQGKSNE